MRQRPVLDRESSANHLLAGLPPTYRRQLVHRCETVDLKFGVGLATSDRRISHVYFPLSGFISVIVPADASHTLEVGLIGREGMLGATLLLGVATSPLQALVQGDGVALRMTATRFRTALDESASLRVLIGRYCFVMLRQCAQSAACAHYHAVAARLARWILMTQDRVLGSELQLTQDFLSRMLGARRVGVTQAASSLKAAKLISYQRGQMSIRDRAGLEAVACSCYATERRIYRRILG